MRYVNPLGFRTLFILSLVQITAMLCAAQKLKPEDVVTKHLDSIVTAESRAAITSRVAQGSAITTIRIGGNGQSTGGAVMASQGRMSLIGIVIAPQDYSNEKAAFDGTKLTLGELTPGNRTRLGVFFKEHDIMFKEGLIGGILFGSMALTGSVSQKPEVEIHWTQKN